MRKFGVLVFTLLTCLIITGCGREKERFTVTFDSDGGSSIIPIEVDENGIVLEPTTTKDGYVFVGWYLNGVKFDFNTKITKDITLTAVWEKETVTEPDDEPTVSVEKYSVKFNSDGGSAVKTQYVEVNKRATKPTNPTKDGYTFKGWYLNGVEYNFNSKVTKDITLKAKWEENKVTVVKYTVTFDSKGGNTIKAQTVDANAKALEPSEPTRDGFVFKGWYLGTTKFDFNSKVTKNITLVAKWEEAEVETVTYTVVFNSDGGSEVASQKVEENKLATKPENPTRTGYTFKGWYLDGAEYKFDSKVTKDITLKATWSPVIEVKILKKPGSDDPNQRQLFIYAAGVPVDAIVDIEMITGNKVKDFEIPKTGFDMRNETNESLITNIRIK